MAQGSRKFTKNSDGMKKNALCALLSFILFCGLTLLLIWITNRYILTVNFYESSGEPLGGDRVQDFQLYGDIIKWVYVFTIAYLLAKILLITVLLQSALYLSGNTVSFSRLMIRVIVAESIFFIPAIIKIYWFHTYFPDGNLLEWHRFSLLSLSSCFPNAPADWLYALQTVNIFELGYWFLLAYGIMNASGLNYDRSIQIVVRSYLPALLVWVIAVTFCALLLSPATG